MLPPAFSTEPESREAREFEQLLEESIAAVKNGNQTLAKSLLDQAALINGADARVWIWLSATTDDLHERRNYLERAVAVDPSNSIAQRGLQVLAEKLDQPHPIPIVETHAVEAEPAKEEEESKTYTCPNCGAKIPYYITDLNLVCQFCGFTRKIDERVVSESEDQESDVVLPTSHAHSWIEKQTRVTCEQCGVVIILPPGQSAVSCPYCASGRFTSSSTLVEMVDPQVVGEFKIDPQKAEKSIKSWLSSGLFAPDDLAARHAGMQLHPAYYPFWIFNGTLEIPWFCDVNIGTPKAPAWEAHSGTQSETFEDVLIPGLRKMSAAELARIEPFNLADLVEFSPEILANWLAVANDHPLADASLQAREKVIKSAQRTLSSKVEAGKSKRNFSIGVGRWSDLTYKIALLPIYIGNYPFQGKRYRLLVNGQTGKVGGKKPVDTLKAGMYIIGGVIVLAIVMAIFWMLRKFLTG